MEIKALLKLLTQIIYILCGLVSISTGIRGLKNEKAKIGTFLFWANIYFWACYSIQSYWRSPCSSCYNYCNKTASYRKI